MCYSVSKVGTINWGVIMTLPVKLLAYYFRVIYLQSSWALIRKLCRRRCSRVCVSFRVTELPHSVFQACLDPMGCRLCQNTYFCWLVFFHRLVTFGGDKPIFFTPNMRRFQSRATISVQSDDFGPERWFQSRAMISVQSDDFSAERQFQFRAMIQVRSDDCSSERRFQFRATIPVRSDDFSSEWRFQSRATIPVLAERFLARAMILVLARATITIPDQPEHDWPDAKRPCIPVHVTSHDGSAA